MWIFSEVKFGYSACLLKSHAESTELADLMIFSRCCLSFWTCLSTPIMSFMTLEIYFNYFSGISCFSIGATKLINESGDLALDAGPFLFLTPFGWLLKEFEKASTSRCQ